MNDVCFSTCETCTKYQDWLTNSSKEREWFTMILHITRHESMSRVRNFSPADFLDFTHQLNRFLVSLIKDMKKTSLFDDISFNTLTRWGGICDEDILMLFDEVENKLPLDIRVLCFTDFVQFLSHVLNTLRFSVCLRTTLFFSSEQSRILNTMMW